MICLRFGSMQSLRITGQDALARDAVHDSFVQLWHDAHYFDPARGAAEAWRFRQVSRQQVKPVLAIMLRDRSGRFQDGQHGHGPAEGEQSAASGGNVLVAAGTEAEEVAQLVVASTEPGG